MLPPVVSWQRGPGEAQLQAQAGRSQEMGAVGEEKKNI